MLLLFGVSATTDDNDDSHGEDKHDHDERAGMSRHDGGAKICCMLCLI